MDVLRSIPQVDQVLREVASLQRVGPAVARWLVRREIEAARRRALDGDAPGDVVAAVDAAVARLERTGLRRVINATGVVLHTNLGRAQLGADALDAIVRAAGASTLEFDLDSGERGPRAPAAATLAAALCDAEDALVVNNNAAALLLALAALAKGREVIVSRGELIEIGGEFRLPDVMEASGAILREVGTTNRTHLRDHERALSDRTALILKVHPSNYEIVGFTAQPSTDELAALAHRAGVPLLYDVGSGLLRPEEGSLADEPDAASALAAGADLVCFSGDKLLGGPQAGIIAGNAELIARLRRHPIARAVRADKLSLAAMEATLWGVARGTPNPTRAMLDARLDEVRARAESFASRFPGARVDDGESVTGGGSLPGRSLPSSVVVFESPHPQNIATRLRRADPPVVTRVERGALVIDLRTVPLDDEHALVSALRAALDAFTVRVAHPEDARAIATMQVESMRAAYRGIVADHLLDSYRVSEFEAWRRRAIAERRAAGGETFVAVRDGSVLAFATCGPCRDEDAAGAGELYGLYAAPSEWGKGIGRDLIVATDEHLARAHDVAVIWTFERNERARRAYERAGYALDGARRENATFGGAIEVRYRKALR